MTALALAGIGALVVAATFALAPFLGGVFAVGFLIYLVTACITAAVVGRGRRQVLPVYALPVVGWIVSVIAYTGLDAQMSGTLDLA